MIVFLDTIRPKYLAGRRVELLAVSGGWATVRCPDEPGYEAHRGRRLKCPLSVLAGWDAATPDLCL